MKRGISVLAIIILIGSIYYSVYELAKTSYENTKKIVDEIPSAEKIYNVSDPTMRSIIDTNYKMLSTTLNLTYTGIVAGIILEFILIVVLILAVFIVIELTRTQTF